MTADSRAGLLTFNIKYANMINGFLPGLLKERYGMGYPIGFAWAGGFAMGDAVRHGERNAHVFSFPKDYVPKGMVPIVYDEDNGVFYTIPADDLDRRRNAPSCEEPSA
jgi:hypothetical protein